MLQWYQKNVKDFENISNYRDYEFNLSWCTFYHMIFPNLVFYQRDILNIGPWRCPRIVINNKPYGVILCPIYGIGFSIVNWRRITCSNSWRLNFTVSLSSIRNTSIAVYTCYLVHILSKYICKLQSHQQKAFYDSVGL